MVKRPRGSAALVSPCWRLGIWPLFGDQGCNFLRLPLFSVAFGRLGQMNKTKALFKIILLYAHPFMLYFFIIKWAHVLMPLFHPTSTFCNFAPFSFFLSLLIPSFPLFPSFPHLGLPSLLLSAGLCISPSISPSRPCFPPCSAPPFPLRCIHFCDRLLLTHSTSAAPQMRTGRAAEQRGAHDAGPVEQGLMKPA